MIRPFFGSAVHQLRLFSVLRISSWGSLLIIVLFNLILECDYSLVNKNVTLASFGNIINSTLSLAASFPYPSPCVWPQITIFFPHLSYHRRIKNFYIYKSFSGRPTVKIYSFFNDLNLKAHQLVHIDNINKYFK